ncbi:MAG: RHS repeat-associated core domain-containing protein, partial [Legionellales bacterium]
GVKAPVEAGAQINLRFPGQYYDEQSGLYYNHNRYYNPELGRYMEPDLIGLEGGLNPYSYADNDPVNLTDPSGLCPMCIATGAIGGALGFGSTALASYYTTGKVDWRGSFAAGAIGGAAGFVAPLTGLGYAGAAIMGAAAGGAQYLVGTPQDELTWSGGFYSAGVGAIAGAGAGRVAAASIQPITATAIGSATAATLRDATSMTRATVSASVSAVATTSPFMNAVNRVPTQVGSFFSGAAANSAPTQLNNALYSTYQQGNSPNWGSLDGSTCFSGCGSAFPTGVFVPSNYP